MRNYQRQSKYVNGLGVSGIHFQDIHMCFKPAWSLASLLERYSNLFVKISDLFRYNLFGRLEDVRKWRMIVWSIAFLSVVRWYRQQTPKHSGSHQLQRQFSVLLLRKSFTRFALSLSHGSWFKFRSFSTSFLVRPKSYLTLLLRLQSPERITTLETTASSCFGY